MTFSAINTYELELKQRSERRTLEVQLDQAMEVYQSALSAQSAGDLTRSFAQYEKLFTFEVLQPQKLGVNHISQDESGVNSSRDQVGPAIRLRAMALKNFALLLLSQRDGVTEETANEVLKYLAESLSLVGSTDPLRLVLPSMVSVFWALGFKQMAKEALDIIVENQGGNALEPLRTWVQNREVALRHFGPKTIEFLECWDYMRLESPDKPAPPLLTQFSNLRELAESEPSLRDTLDAESTLVVSLPAKSWERLVASINDSLNSTSRRGKRRNPNDAYSASLRDIWDVSIQGILFRGNSVPPQTPEEQPGEENDEGGSKAENGEFDEHASGDEHGDEQRSLDDRDESVGAENASNFENHSGSHSGNHKETHLENHNENHIENHSGNHTEKHTENHPESRSESRSEKSTVAENHSPKDLSAHTKRLNEDRLASPAKRRRGERAKRSTVTLPADFGFQDANFALQFNAYLALTGLDFSFVSPASLFLDSSLEPSAELSGAADFRDVLTYWSNRDSNQLLAKAASARPQREGIMTILKRGNVPSGDADDLEDDLDADLDAESEAVDAFVNSHVHLHIQQLRWRLTLELLARLSEGGHSRKFAQLVFSFVDDLEGILFSRRRFLNGDLLQIVYGLYADNWIRNRGDDVKLHRWRLASSQSSSLSHVWISAFVDQETETASPEESVAQFEIILQHIPETDEFANMFSHLREIPELSKQNAQVQISKFKAASAFERVLMPAALREEASNVKDIELLEAMLMPDNHKKPTWISAQEFDAILSFLSKAAAQFKMGLWYMLLEKYEASGSAADSMTGLTRIFLEAQSAYANGEPLTSTLSVCHDVGTRLVGLLERSPNLLFEMQGLEHCRNVLKNIVTLLQTLHLFLLYDEAVNSNLMQKPVTPSWTEAADKLRELVVLWWTLFYRFWLRCLGDNASTETCNDILSIIHERLGHLGYCGLAKGCLLTLHIREICRLDWDGSSLDICQCMKCKFGFNLTLSGDITNHHTVPVELTTVDAQLVLPLIMRLILHHRSYNQLVMRTDIRSAIDAFANVLNVGDSEQNVSRVIHLRRFLETEFTPTMLHQAWHGRTSSMLGFSNSDDCYAIWVVQAHVLLTQYRMRRRQAYSVGSVKTETLLSAVTLFIQDLAARPARFESWVGLASAYMYLMEDCLSFGDEVAVPRKPELYCRQALLAMSQAVALQVGGEQEISVAQPESYRNLKSTVFSTFGNLLFIAAMPPLLSQPFKLTQRPLKPLLVRLSDPGSSRIGTIKPCIVDEKVALNLAIRCLSQPAAEQDWINAIRQTKAALKLGLPTEAILSFAERARKSAPPSQASAEVEFLNAVWVCYRNGKLDDGEARSVLKVEEGDVIQVIEDRLRKLANNDKWLHRARFLVSQIELLDKSNSVMAQEELLCLFTLKSPTKPLVIWNTEDGLPGDYSVAMSLYCRTLAELMFTNGDSSGLLLLVRRFRRTASEMWCHSQTCDFIHGKACQLVMQKTHILPNQLRLGDSLITELSNDGNINFTVAVKNMSDPLVSGYSESDPWVQLLFYVLELRKTQTGPSTLAAADELAICIFTTMLKDFAKKKPEKARDPPEEAPAAEQDVKKEKARNKKIMRRDVVNASQQFMKQFQATFAKVDNIGIPDAEFRCTEQSSL